MGESAWYIATPEPRISFVWDPSVKIIEIWAKERGIKINLVEERQGLRGCWGGKNVSFVSVREMEGGGCLCEPIDMNSLVFPV